jgi:hypothetical protein
MTIGEHMRASEFFPARWLKTCLLAVFATAVAAAPWSGTHKAQIEDPFYNMSAATIEVPNGWRFAGTVAHEPTCRTNGNAIKFTALSPDSNTAIILLPGAHWMWNSSPARTMAAQRCSDIDISSASNFLVNIVVPSVAPRAKIVAVQPFPPEAQASLAKLQRQAQEQNATMAARIGGKPAKTTIEGARVRIQFSQGGQAFEEQVASVVDCIESQMPAMYKTPANTRRSCTARSIQITRTPTGRLDALLKDPQYAALQKGLELNPQWSARVQHDGQEALQKFQAANNAQFQSFMKNAQDQHNARMAQGAQFQQNMQQSHDQAMAADRAHQDAIDASAHATALHSLDQQEFRNPSTGEIIRASDQYNHQWLSSDGKTLIQADDHTFNPNGVVDPIRESWTELEPKPLK